MHNILIEEHRHTYEEPPHTIIMFERQWADKPWYCIGMIENEPDTFDAFRSAPSATPHYPANRAYTISREDFTRIMEARP